MANGRPPHYGRGRAPPGRAEQARAARSGAALFLFSGLGDTSIRLSYIEHRIECSNAHIQSFQLSLMCNETHHKPDGQRGVDGEDQCRGCGRVAQVRPSRASIENRRRNADRPASLRMVVHAWSDRMPCQVSFNSKSSVAQAAGAVARDGCGKAEGLAI
jgi:hypothetical protein